jgi:hypothetical protein
LLFAVADLVPEMIRYFSRDKAEKTATPVG